MTLPYSPQIGEVVHYYLTGSRADSPIPAIVVGPESLGPDGRLNLALVRDQSLQLGTQRAVPHADDPYLVSHPQFARSRGAWDFTPLGKLVRAMEQKLARAPKKD
jgi:hypothetical protein